MPTIGRADVLPTESLNSGAQAPHLPEHQRPRVKSIDTWLRQLTFDDLSQWAGEAILSRGKGYMLKKGDE